VRSLPLADIQIQAMLSGTASRLLKI